MRNDINYDDLLVSIAEELDEKLGREATDEEIEAEYDRIIRGIDDSIDDSLNGN